MESLWDLLQSSVKRYPDRVALTIRRDSSIDSWTYEKLAETGERIASWLLSKTTLSAGDRVLLWAPNTPEWVGMFFGCIRASIVLVPLDVRSHPSFIRNVQDQAGAKMALVDRALRAEFPDLGIPVEILDHVYVRASQSPYSLAWPLPAPGDVAEIVFTSGTTGRPKGVVLTHSNVTANVRAGTAVVPAQPDYRLLSLLPLSHMLEQTVGLLSPLSGGGCVAFAANRNPSVIVQAFNDHKITSVVLVPQVLQLLWNGLEREVARQGRQRMFVRMLAVAERLPMWGRRLLFRRVHRRLGGALKFVMCGGARLDPELAGNWEALGVPVLQGYGTTEASPIVTTNRHAGRRADTCGLPLPGVEVQIAPDGEVLVKGPNVTSGYWRDESATKAAFSDGWYHTGDLGAFDADGHLILNGRKKDLIVLENGMNVYPEDVEAALTAHPAVKDACVVGLSDGTGAIRIHAALLLEEGSPNHSEIVASANATLATHQRVRGVTVWQDPDFPRTHTLKVKKHEVLERLNGVSGATPATGTESGNEPGSFFPPLYRLVAEIGSLSSASLRGDMRLEDDLGLDSLLRVELLSTIEAESGQYVDESEIGPDTTLAELEALTAQTDALMARPKFARWPTGKLASAVRLVLQAGIVLPLAHLVIPSRVVGVERVPVREGPVILAANHMSNFDTPAIVAALPRRQRSKLSVAAAADAWYEGARIKGALASLLFNAFPFSRGGSVRPSLEHCRHLIEDGWSVLIYPEGTRSRTGLMGPFKSGTGLMSVELGVPVIPVAVSGTFEVLGAGRRRPRRGRVSVTFGDPIRFDQGMTYVEATKVIEEAVRALGVESRTPQASSRSENAA